MIHLAPDGDDRGNGSSARPFATPARALAEARRRRGATRVMVHDGVYEMAAPLVFGPADSGQVWSAAPGAKPVFSGGRRLAGWTVGRHKGQTAWRLELPEVRAGKWHFTQLWVDGQRRSRPRLPKSGFHRFSGLDGQPDSGFSWNAGPDHAEYPEGTISRFANLGDVSLVAYQLWFDTHHRIKAVDERRRMVHFHARSLGRIVGCWIR